MPQLGQGPTFLAQPVARPGVEKALGVQDLERDARIQVDMQGLVDDAETTLADLPLDPISVIQDRADLDAGCQDGCGGAEVKLDAFQLQSKEWRVDVVRRAGLQRESCLRLGVMGQNPDHREIVESHLSTKGLDGAEDVGGALDLSDQDQIDWGLASGRDTDHLVTAAHLDEAEAPRSEGLPITASGRRIDVGQENCLSHRTCSGHLGRQRRHHS